MEQPTEGFFAHGGSENKNHGPIRVAVLDLERGKVVMDVYDRTDRPEMKHGTCCDAATVAALSAVIWALKHRRKPLVWVKDANAMKRAEGFLYWRRKGTPPYEQFDHDGWHPLVLQAFRALPEDLEDTELRLWDKRIYGDNPLAYGWEGTNVKKTRI